MDSIDEDNILDDNDDQIYTQSTNELKVIKRQDLSSYFSFTHTPVDILRNQVKEYLKKYYTGENSISNIEQSLYSCCTTFNSKLYICYLQHFMSLHKKGYNDNYIFQLINNHQLDALFNSMIFNQSREIEKKEIKRIQTPLEVVEGIFVCKKCNGSKTYSYSLQIRSSDEPPTVFIHCMNKTCKYSWREG